MSLGQLLATGKSVTGVRDEESRYRLEKHSSLPKFLSTRNQLAPSKTFVDGEARAKRTTPASAKPAAAANLKATQRIPAPTISRQATRPAKRGFGDRLRAMVEWARVKCRRPLALRRTEADGLARTSPAVQAELSLDKVKVVRNDFSEAEGAGAGQGTGADSATSASARLITASAGAVRWNRLTTMIFGNDSR